MSLDNEGKHALKGKDFSTEDTAGYQVTFIQLFSASFVKIFFF